MAQLSRRFHLSQLKHWPGPRSLATTNGVSVDVLSSGYLDVSVPRVCLWPLCIQDQIPFARWVSPFGNLRVKACSQLTVAYRSVPRPSSPLAAKASSGMPLGHLIALISNAHLREPAAARALEARDRVLLLLGTVNTAYRKTSCIEINPNGRPARSASLRPLAYDPSAQ